MENYFEIRHEKLYVFGVLGKLERTLQQLSSLCKNGKLEFAPVKEGSGRDFLAGFYYPPAIDITLDRLRNKESSIVAYSLSKDEALRVIDEIIGKSGFKVIKPDPSFVRQITSELTIEIRTYALIEAMVASVGSVDFEQMWGLSRYTHFLQYKNYSEEQATELAADKFNIPPKIRRLLKK